MSNVHKLALPCNRQDTTTSKYKSSKFRKCICHECTIKRVHLDFLQMQSDKRHHSGPAPIHFSILSKHSSYSIPFSIKFENHWLRSHSPVSGASEPAEFPLEFPQEARACNKDGSLGQGSTSPGSQLSVRTKTNRCELAVPRFIKVPSTVPSSGKVLKIQNFIGRRHGVEIS